MNVGAYYYPEHWPRKQWERDIGNIAKMGFDFTHFGEFAWAFMEPEEGKYDFEWLDEAVAIASKNGLKVIMCTPTPTPPAWMAEQYPEILMTNSDGSIFYIGLMNSAGFPFGGRRIHIPRTHPRVSYLPWISCIWICHFKC